MYRLSYIEWLDDINFYSVVETPALQDDLNIILEVDNALKTDRIRDIAFIEW